MNSDGDASRAVPWFPRSRHVEGITAHGRQSGVDVTAIRRGIGPSDDRRGLTRCACSKDGTPWPGIRASSARHPQRAVSACDGPSNIPGTTLKLIVLLPGCCGNTAHRSLQRLLIYSAASPSSSPRTGERPVGGAVLFFSLWLNAQRLRIFAASSPSPWRTGGQKY